MLRHAVECVVLWLSVARTRLWRGPMVRLLSGALLVGCLLRTAAADPSRHFAPQHWYCTQEHASSMLCKTANLKEAIAIATDPAEKQEKVNVFKAAVLRGDAEAEGLDATNPERQRMMDAWCESSDEARTSDPKSGVLCAKFKAKRSFMQRREMLLNYWCDEQGHKGSPKCLQMAFGKRMQETDSGEERKRIATEFRADRSPESQAALEKETKEMMQAACASDTLGKDALFTLTCSKLHTEL